MPDLAGLLARAARHGGPAEDAALEVRPHIILLLLLYGQVTDAIDRSIDDWLTPSSSGTSPTLLLL